MDKEFSADFEKDILELAKTCFANQTDNLTLQFDYEKFGIDINMTFRVHANGEVKE